LPDALEIMGRKPLLQRNIYFNRDKRMIAFKMEGSYDNRNAATRTNTEGGTSVGMALIILLIMMVGRVF
jgi:hypothetical protein